MKITTATVAFTLIATTVSAKGDEGAVTPVKVTDNPNMTAKAGKMMKKSGSTKAAKAATYTCDLTSPAEQLTTLSLFARTTQGLVDTFPGDSNELNLGYLGVQFLETELGKWAVKSDTDKNGKLSQEELMVGFNEYFEGKCASEVYSELNAVIAATSQSWATSNIYKPDLGDRFGAFQL